MSDKKITLVVLAAGMGSRYGGLKQLDKLGPNGETILDYSVYDAYHSGFEKVVFVIRDFFADEFREKVGKKFEQHMEVHYIFQDVNPQFDFLDVELNREKPWGTNHAILVAKDVVNEPFAVINADDYYGRDGFGKMSHFLKNECREENYSMIGYRISNTLSESGTVNRGVAVVQDGHLVDVIERLKIGIDSDGSYTSRPEEGIEIPIDTNAIVSMNFWGFHQNYFDHCEAGFHEFVKKNYEKPKAEYFIPLLVDDMIKSERAKVEVIASEDKWYGVTYKEDADDVRKAFVKFADDKKYPSPLWT